MKKKYNKKVIGFGKNGIIPEAVLTPEYLAWERKSAQDCSPEWLDFVRTYKKALTKYNGLEGFHIRTLLSYVVKAYDKASTACEKQAILAVISTACFEYGEPYTDENGVRKWDIVKIVPFATEALLAYERAFRRVRLSRERILPTLRNNSWPAED